MSVVRKLFGNYLKTVTWIQLISKWSAFLDQGPWFTDCCGFGPYTTE